MKGSLTHIYVVQQDTHCFVIEFIRNIWWLDMFRTSLVHSQERLQAYAANLVCGILRTTRYVQMLCGCSFARSETCRATKCYE